MQLLAIDMWGYRRWTRAKFLVQLYAGSTLKASRAKRVSNDGYGLLILMRM